MHLMTELLLMVMVVTLWGVDVCAIVPYGKNGRRRHMVFLFCC